MKPVLHKGDIFCTENAQGFVGKIINFFQRNYNRDGKSKYTHAGVVIDESGATFEALPNGYHRQNIFEVYKGKNIVIFRSKYMTDEKFSKGWDSIKDLEGKWYPWHRLPLFIFPPLSGFNLVNKPVCSETDRKLLFHAGIPQNTELMAKMIPHVGKRGIYGVDPDDLVDLCRANEDYVLVYEDNLIFDEESV